MPSQESHRLARMGRRHRGDSSWWSEKTNGVQNWIGVLLVAVLVVASGIGIAALSNRPSQTATATYTPGPRLTPSSTPTEVTMAVFIGDSYTAGVGGTAGGFAPAVAKVKGGAFESLGRGGTGYITNTEQSARDAQNACARDYCESFAEMIEPAVALDPDVVIVSGGRNNARSEEDDLRESISAFYRDIRSRLPEARIIATSPLWDASTPPSSITRIAEIVRESVESVGGTYLDLGQPFEGKPEYISDDEVHPNDKGYRLLSEKITSLISSS